MSFGEQSLVVLCHAVWQPQQVGPGVKDLSEGDVVLPTAPLLGTFTQAAVVKAKQWVRVGRLASEDGAHAGDAADSGSSSQTAKGELRVAFALADVIQPRQSLALT